MPRRKAEPTEEPTPVAEAPVAAQPEQLSTEPPAAIVEREDSGTKVNRISLVITDKGIDFGSMREGTKAKLKQSLQQTLKEKDGAKNLGLGAEAADTPAFNAESAKGFLSVLGPIEAALFKVTVKCPSELALKYCVYSDTEKNLMAQPLATVANKYAPDGVKKYADELNLLTIWGQIQWMRYAAIRAEMQKLAEEQGGSGEGQEPKKEQVM